MGGICQVSGRETNACNSVDGKVINEVGGGQVFGNGVLEAQERLKMARMHYHMIN
jgi:hypothetical protein